MFYVSDYQCGTCAYDNQSLAALEYFELQRKNTYFKPEGDGLKAVSFGEFEELSYEKKTTVLRRLDEFIDANQECYDLIETIKELSECLFLGLEQKKNITASQHKFEEFMLIKMKSCCSSAIALNRVKEMRNLVFYSLNKGVVPAIPANVLEHYIYPHVSVRDIANLKSVRKDWARGATRKAQIRTINQGLRLKDALHPKIKSAEAAIEWLKSDLQACEHIIFADFIGFEDFTQSDLRELIKSCPHLRFLAFESKEMTVLEEVPASLQQLVCFKCPQLVSIGTLPDSIVKLELEKCPKLMSIVKLSEKLEELTCISCHMLRLTTLPDSLRKLFFKDCFVVSELPYALREFVVEECPVVSSLPSLPVLLEKLVLFRCHALTKLPELPSSLQKLRCANCKLAELPVLPDSLLELAVIECNLTALPPLPPLLQKLCCEVCPMKYLPDFPSGLREISVNCFELKSLPALPPLLIKLRCHCFCLGNLPELPLSLEELSYSFCYSLRTHPTLPLFLNKLDCSHTNLKTLPELPPYLQELDCGNEHLIVLPELPDTITKLDCSFSKNLKTILKLPVFLQVFDCHTCGSLSSLPELPATLKELDSSRCALQELPILPRGLLELSVKDCPELIKLINFPPSLQRLDFSNCPKLYEIAELPLSIEYLQSSGCRSRNNESRKHIKMFKQIKNKPRASDV